MKKYDVVVVGGGPSGASTAYKLAEAGIRCALIEKEKLPRYKTCGGGVTYRARKLLPIGIQPAVEREFRKAQLNFIKEDQLYEVERADPIISMTMRDKLDHLLVNAAASKGAEVMDSCSVNGLHANGAISLETTFGEITTDFVIAADGALSPVAKMAGWKESRHLIPALEYEVQVSTDDFEKLSNQARFDIDAIPSGYAWSFPKTNHLSLGVASTKRGKLNLKAYYKEYLKFLGIEKIVSEQAHGFQIPISPRTDSFYKDNILLTGDAAGFADPVTAEGISNAILSGQLAAQAIINGQLNPAEVKQNFEQLLQAHLLPQLSIGRKLADILYNHSWVRKPLFKTYGQKLSEALTDVFMGEREYPVDAVGHIKDFIRHKLRRSFSN